MNIEVPIVRVALHTHTIPIPFGMSVLEAWETIYLANKEHRPAWPSDTLIKGYLCVVAHPNGRIVAIG